MQQNPLLQELKPWFCFIGVINSSALFFPFHLANQRCISIGKSQIDLATSKPRKHQANVDLLFEIPYSNGPLNTQFLLHDWLTQEYHPYTIQGWLPYHEFFWQIKCDQLDSVIAKSQPIPHPSNPDRMKKERRKSNRGEKKKREKRSNMAQGHVTLQKKEGCLLLIVLANRKPTMDARLLDSRGKINMHFIFF